MNNNSLISLNKKYFKYEKLRNKFKLKVDIKFKIILLLLIIIIYLLYIFNDKIKKYYKSILFQKENNIYFHYHNYQRDLITEKMIKNANWQMSKNEPYFINGIIRKFKPKKCLEVGVAYGGASIVILNALKDIENSFLISLDINTNLYSDINQKTGCKVNEYFPELTKKWKLLTGEPPHKFLDKLNIKFDFLLLDTVHQSPGELINIIEILPFLEENAIIVLHDIMFHLPSNQYFTPNYVKYHPSNIYLMTTLVGNKVIIKDKEKGLENIGAIFLASNQENYYLNYFLLLLTPWEYMPKDSYINELKDFILKYYKKDIFSLLFNRAVEENKIYINKFQSLYNQIFK